MISFIIPTYNESSVIKQSLLHLTELIGFEDEIIVVDGNSEDLTKKISESFDKVRVIDSPRGRSVQMNAGARVARGEYLLFLHADVLIDQNCILMLKNEIKEQGILWGWFKFELDSPKLIYRIIEFLSNVRNRISRIPLGDHGIFVQRDLFFKVGGFPNVSIMEDIEFSRSINFITKGKEINTPIKISVRRFEREGIFSTIAKMWIVRSLYYVGVKPSLLSKIYTDIR